MLVYEHKKLGCMKFLSLKKRKKKVTKILRTQKHKHDMNENI
jgi:hypothetical protein